MSMTGNKPPFRPNHLPTVAGRNPVAPPVYRPQPVPRVLQAKPSQMKAPSVYRPQPVPVFYKRRRRRLYLLIKGRRQRVRSSARR
jgi:hypothetical protein